MKFAIDLFPKGTFKDQQTDGAYIDDTLAENLNIIAEKINHDMQFTILITGTDMVGNGKTTLATQVGSYLTCKINEMHGTTNNFTHDNIIFKGADLAKRSFEMPKLSVLVLDEGDDLTTHGMRQEAVNLKRYFRKCRQLNQVLILILPSFFELPKFYALSRSQALINVRFEEKFERGYFSFYGMTSKKMLYILGKKEWDYQAYKKDFQGRFSSSYCFFPECNKEVEMYKARKYQDMVEDQEDKVILTEDRIRKEERKILFTLMKKSLPIISIEKLSDVFGIDPRTGWNWAKDIEKGLNNSPMGP